MYEQELSKQTNTEEMVRAESTHSFFLRLGAQALRFLRYGLTCEVSRAEGPGTDTKEKSLGPEGSEVPAFANWWPR